MNVVDSSGWLEFFADSKQADFFSPPILDTAKLLVPSVTLAEVFKKIFIERGEDNALQALAFMQQGKVIPLDTTLAILAAKLGLEHKIPFVDSIILATACHHNAILWTQDADFHNLPGVRYKPKN